MIKIEPEAWYFLVKSKGELHVQNNREWRCIIKMFLLIYHKAKAGQLEADSGLSALAKITEIDIHEVGVDGAKNFFEAKIEQLKAQSKFETEVKKEQEEKRKMETEKKQKRMEFQQKHAFFEQVTLTH